MPETTAGEATEKDILTLTFSLCIYLHRPLKLTPNTHKLTHKTRKHIAYMNTHTQSKRLSLIFFSLFIYLFAFGFPRQNFSV